MTISSIDPTLLGQVNALSGSAVTPAAGATTDTDASGSASVSPFAQILSRLEQLQQSDPTKLKTALTDIANQLQATAQADGGRDGQALSNLANKFQQAAQTGDLSALRPTQHQHQHHHHGGHHGGAAAYQQTSDQTPLPGSSVQTDPRSQVLDIIDSVLNQDASTTPAAG